MTLPTLQAHLQAAQATRDAVKGGGRASRADKAAGSTAPAESKPGKA